MTLAHAIFAAGCFWGVQAAFDAVPGVWSTRVGYTGGSAVNPSYEQVCRGNTGHAEAVEIAYDPEQVSYDELLDVFFSIHNPTTRDRQGPDIGHQYRSAIFYLNAGQKEAAVAKILELNRSGKFPAPIVTEIVPAKTFYPAEDYHQDYLKKQGLKTCGSNDMRMEEEEEEETDDEQEWKKKLTPLQYDVLRRKGTERPFTGRYYRFDEDGTYSCAACGNPIFMSQDKFDSGCGWPSFDKAIPGHVKFTPDFSHGMERIEVTCARCGSHLGHVFEDGPTETGDRFCINSAAMNFTPEKDTAKD
ncbi:MAG: peptide-methionine (S)-S-oxide reductase MsrA [Alphaproteobacteria bacterium]|nr:peptide-methionine (S)-S-oxide reductase MsrA [Alphaproteobacteria bacterium]CDB53778.1 peptide methionine sulfoxide reductase msrA (Protein-methionine-S-oxide reductase) (Peptide Met(O) reductase) (Modular protein) [Azospirillum sp. CAG:239]